MCLRSDLTLGGALALMIFFAFAMQCTSTMAVVRRETNGWKWPAIQFGYMLVLAWVAAFAANHITMYFLRQLRPVGCYFAGGMFWLKRNKFSGSYCTLMAARRWNRASL